MTGAPDPGAILQLLVDSPGGINYLQLMKDLGLPTGFT